MIRKHFDRLRMLAWLVVGLAMYAVSIAIGIDYPAAQTVAYKLGHVTTLAWVGYWIARHAIGRLVDNSLPTDRLARAVLIGSVIIAGSMGL